jgi:hypothetical protein
MKVWDDLKTRLLSEIGATLRKKYSYINELDIEDQIVASLAIMDKDGKGVYKASIIKEFEFTKRLFDVAIASLQQKRMILVRRSGCTYNEGGGSACFGPPRPGSSETNYYILTEEGLNYAMKKKVIKY